MQAKRPQSRSSGREQRSAEVYQAMEQRGVTFDGGAGHRAGAMGRATEQEQAGSPSVCGAKRSMSLVFFFPYPTGVTEETNADT